MGLFASLCRGGVDRGVHVCGGRWVNGGEGKAYVACVRPRWADGAWMWLRWARWSRGMRVGQMCARGGRVVPVCACGGWVVDVCARSARVVPMCARRARVVDGHAPR